MKQSLLIVCMALFLGSCKDANSSSEASENKVAEAKANSNEDLITMKGNFVYHQDAAVLQTPTQIYGVVINSKMNELDKQAQKFKKVDTDMVSATVKVNRFQNPSGEGWPYLVEIREIFKVEAIEQTNDVIQLAK